MILLKDIIYTLHLFNRLDYTLQIRFQEIFP